MSCSEGRGHLEVVLKLGPGALLLGWQGWGVCIKGLQPFLPANPFPGCNCCLGPGQWPTLILTCLHVPGGARLHPPFPLMGSPGSHSRCPATSRPPAAP